MINSAAPEQVKSLLIEGMALAKCRKCACMKDNFSLEIPPDLQEMFAQYQEKLETTEYAWLGCKFCYGAELTNALNQIIPGLVQTPILECKTDGTRQGWLPIPGEYFALSETGPVAISTLASTELAETLASMRPPELGIVGKNETENIGIEKIIKNILSTPAIRYLIVAGYDTEGHQSGKTILALWENGLDEGMRVIGSPAKNPVLRNVTLEEVEAFRKQVKVIDMVGCEDENTIIDKLNEIIQDMDLSCTCKDCTTRTKPVQIQSVPVIQAKEPSKIEMDKAGYFVILPLAEKKIIRAEHYSYDNRLLRIIEGSNARNLYWTIIENGWVSQLSHASYIGKELVKAELSIEHGFKYKQDGA